MNPASVNSGWVLGDIGNSRIKLVWMADGKAGVDRLFEQAPQKYWDERLTLPTDGIDRQANALRAWLTGKSLGSIWLSSVHPQATQQLVALLDQIFEEIDAADIDGSVIASAFDVEIPNRLAQPEKSGADRALAVRAARRLYGTTRPGAIVLCGTAMTVERVDHEGVWLGGAIAPGYRLGAEALQHGTAGLMQVGPVSQPPIPYGVETKTAIQAGLFWGQVGTARELVRQTTTNLTDFWEIWSGGDAALFAPHAAGPHAAVIDDLVLLGLADLAASS